MGWLLYVLSFKWLFPDAPPKRPAKSRTAIKPEKKEPSTLEMIDAANRMNALAAHLRMCDMMARANPTEENKAKAASAAFLLEAELERQERFIFGNGGH